MCIGAGLSGRGKEDKAKIRMCRGREVSTKVRMCRDREVSTKVRMHRGGEKDETKVRISVHVGAGRSAPGSVFVYECVWKGRQDQVQNQCVCVGAGM